MSRSTIYGQLIEETKLFIKCVKVNVKLSKIDPNTVVNLTLRELIHEARRNMNELYDAGILKKEEKE